MPPSHVCLSCGADQGRTRAIAEPHYGLPLVTCPRCGARSVRVVHPIERRWRQLVRLAPAVLVLVLQLGAASGAIIGLTALATVVGNMDGQDWVRTLEAMDRENALVVEVALTILGPPLAVGVWIGLVTHWRNARALLVLAGLVFLGVAIACTVEAWEWSDHRGVPFSLGIVMPDFLRRTIFMVPMFAMTLPGVVIGAALARRTQRVWHAWRRRRRDRRRQARMLST